MKYDYSFYPTLLDAFQRYLDSDTTYEKLYGHSDQPSVTIDEYELQQKEELLNKINRVPFDSEAADRGSCFNEILDCILLQKASTRDDISLCSRSSYERVVIDGMCDPETGVPIGADDRIETINTPHIEAIIGNRTFRFDEEFCKAAAKYYYEALPQLFTQAVIETEKGRVLLYGYIDFLRKDMVYDAKTTNKYEFGKYSKYWQQHVYPWTLIESGKCTSIKAFEFTAFQLRGGTEKRPFITGDMYPEVYVYDHDRSTTLLKGICEQFIDFLNNNQSLISDKKVFGIKS